MRAHNGEHRDSLPVLDVSALRHVAYVFDALVYYMRSLSEPRGDAQKDALSYSTWNDQVNLIFVFLNLISKFIAFISDVKFRVAIEP